MCAATGDAFSAEVSSTSTSGCKRSSLGRMFFLMLCAHRRDVLQQQEPPQVVFSIHLEAGRKAGNGRRHVGRMGMLC